MCRSRAGRYDTGAPRARFSLTYSAWPLAAWAEPPMKPETLAAPSWSTASFGSEADTSPMELTALNEHLQHCNSSHGLVFRLRCAAEALNGFASARFMISLGLVALPALVLSLFL